VLLPDDVNPNSEIGFKIFDMSGHEVSHFPSTICGPSNLKILYLSEFRTGLYSLATYVDGALESTIRMMIK